jgi:hypothetical protein
MSIAELIVAAGDLSWWWLLAPLTPWLLYFFIIIRG